MILTPEQVRQYLKQAGELKDLALEGSVVRDDQTIIMALSHDWLGMAKTCKDGAAAIDTLRRQKHALEEQLAAANERISNLQTQLAEFRKATSSPLPKDYKL